MDNLIKAQIERIGRIQDLIEKGAPIGNKNAARGRKPGRPKGVKPGEIHPDYWETFKRIDNSNDDIMYDEYGRKHEPLYTDYAKDGTMSFIHYKLDGVHRVTSTQHNSDGSSIPFGDKRYNENPIPINAERIPIEYHREQMRLMDEDMREYKRIAEMKRLGQTVPIRYEKRKKD